jgi:hypothetical protein
MNEIYDLLYATVKYATVKHVHAMKAQRKQEYNCNINLYEPCVLYIGRAHRYPPNTPFYIFFQQIYVYVLIFLNMLHTLYFFCSKFRSFRNATFFGKGPGSSVGIATGYGLDGPGIEPRLGRDFSHLSRPDDSKLIYTPWPIGSETKDPESTELEACWAVEMV